MTENYWESDGCKEKQKRKNAARKRESSIKTMEFSVSKKAQAAALQHSAVEV